MTTIGYASGLGIVLTGGESNRMGVNKSELKHPRGGTLATYTAALMSACLESVLEVGTGFAGCDVIFDEEHLGPAHAVCIGVDHFVRNHPDPSAQPFMVASCDLRLLDTRPLNWLLENAAHGSLVPEVGGELQLHLGVISGTSALSLPVPDEAVGMSMITLFERLPDLRILKVDDLPFEVRVQFTDVDTPEEYLSFYNAHGGWGSLGPE